MLLKIVESRARMRCPKSTCVLNQLSVQVHSHILWFDFTYNFLVGIWWSGWRILYSRKHRLAIHGFQCYVARGIYCSGELLANLTYIAQAQSVFPSLCRRHRETHINLSRVGQISCKMKSSRKCRKWLTPCDLPVPGSSKKVNTPVVTSLWLRILFKVHFQAIFRQFF